MKTQPRPILSLRSLMMPGELMNFPPRDPDDGTWNVLIETPQGSRNKFDYDPDRGLFKLKKVLPLGSVFPFDFGFVPSTLADDGDPLDVLVLMDAPAFTGCLVPARLIGVIEGQQLVEGHKQRNDRLIGVAAASHAYKDLNSLKDLPDAPVTEIEHFFISYHELEGKPFKPIGRHGPRHAERLVKEGMEKFFDKLRTSAFEKAG
jgi:inorganic pyrophosphatase